MGGAHSHKSIFSSVADLTKALFLCTQVVNQVFMKGYLDDQTHLREDLHKEDEVLAVFNILLSPSRCGHFASLLDEVESILKKKLT